MKQRKLRWGVLGAARIAVKKVIPAMQRGIHRGRRLASRDRGRRSGGAELGIPKAYGSYEELLADPGHRGRLQPAAQPPPRRVVDPRGRGGQARAVREADRA